MRRVVVELHAQAVDLAGGRRTEVGVAAAATCADLKAALADRHPALAGLLGSSAIATDEEYLAEGVPLGDEARFHLIPPVSGG